MTKILIPILLLALAGCAAVQNAGTAVYSVEPIVVEGKTLCCRVSIANGKEIALLDATVSKRGEDYDVHLHEEGVTAFQGQRIAAGALTAGADIAGKTIALAALAPVFPVMLPAAEAALASPGLAAAAVGAGATLGVQKLMAAPATPGN